MIIHHDPAVLQYQDQKSILLWLGLVPNQDRASAQAALWCFQTVHKVLAVTPLTVSKTHYNGQRSVRLCVLHSVD